MTEIKNQENHSAALNYLKLHCHEGLWPYLPDREPALEPSIWCAIACRGLPVKTLFLRKLLSRQNKDGGWSSYQGAVESDWTTGIALLALRVLGAADESVSSADYTQSFSRAMDFLLDTRTDYYRGVVKALYLLWNGPQYSYPRGWPWTPETFDWVEPTSYTVLSLRGTGFEKTKPQLVPALSDAEQFLLNSYCYPGGWDYADRSGTSAQEKKIRAETGPHKPYPYPSNTTQALLALQGKKGQVIESGLKYLETPSQDRQSLLGLSWSAIGLHAYDRNIDAQLAALVTLQKSDGSFSSDNMSNALATIALGLQKDGNPFKAPLPDRQ